MPELQRFFGLLICIVGLMFLLYGLSYFAIPIIFIILGLILINQGLWLRGIPTGLFFRQYFWRFR